MSETQSLQCQNPGVAKRNPPRYPLKDEHVRHCKVVPSRESFLDLLPRGLTIAEVGVAYGEFTNQIISRCQPKLLYLVDSWGTARYAEGLQRIRTDLSELIARNEIVIKQGLSTDILPTLPDRSLDFIYIDTDHNYETTAKELSISAKKVRDGGRIAGHDYCVGNISKPWRYGVIEAVSEFCNKHGWGFEYLSLESHGHSSFSLRRLSELQSARAAPFLK